MEPSGFVRECATRRAQDCDSLDRWRRDFFFRKDCLGITTRNDGGRSTEELKLFGSNQSWTDVIYTRRRSQRIRIARGTVSRSYWGRNWNE